MNEEQASAGLEALRAQREGRGSASEADAALKTLTACIGQKGRRVAEQRNSDERRHGFTW